MAKRTYKKSQFNLDDQLDSDEVASQAVAADDSVQVTPSEETAVASDEVLQPQAPPKSEPANHNQHSRFSKFKKN